MEESAIQVSHIQKKFGGVTALEEISFKVSKGSIHGFLGPNGAGKSTTMKIITGILKACDGSVIIESKKPIGFLPEHPPLYKNMIVRDFLEFVRDIYKSNSDIESILSKCGLKHVEKRMIRNLSKGYQQRVGIAQALVVDPEIIILDEPTVGLDPHAIKEMRELILSLKENHTILFSTHQLYEASNLCDEVTIINKGRILKSGKIEDVKKDLVSGQIILIDLDSPVKEDDIQLLKSEFELSEINCEGNSLKITTIGEKDIRGEINKFLLDRNYIVTSLKLEEMDLEQIFDKVTSKLDV
ncbi:hypothetical protein A9Q84_03520 [Halobacteriovorax marinus]|uniref:ABC transporter domain-containing protein n=1 Tax=Halobacteriovorax marinus TaxID=97084 RepID=A0A1Y5FFL8_9BACT|nr:hypothetical protein A9Q84_03520 [Halobacteriovorax marinus]